MIKVGDKFNSDRYGEYVVKRYNGCKDIDIEFINTGNMENVKSFPCSKGLAVDHKEVSRQKVEHLKSFIGNSFTDLTVVGVSESSPYKLQCLCSCGTVKYITKVNLTTGHDKSCGCKSYLEDANCIKKVYKAEYNSYKSMLRRCKYFNSVNRKSYWDKNISACDRWLVEGVEGFSNFLEDMGTKPDKAYQLDRIDTEGDYTKDNCRWVSRKVNMNNRGVTVKISILNKEVPLRYLLDLLELDHCTVRDRYLSGVPFIFVFHKGSLRGSAEYKQYKKDNNVSIKRLGSNLGGDIMSDPDKNRAFENLYGETILSYVSELNGEYL